MAGREFGSPPSVIEEFGPEWRNWLYLLYRKVYQRSYSISIATIDGIVDMNAAVSARMTEGLIGFAPVSFSIDSTKQSKMFSLTLPEDWVKGTPLTFGLAFANVQTQSGVVTVATEILLRNTPVGADLGLLTGVIGTTTTSLPLDTGLNTLHYDEIIIAAPANLEPLMSLHFRLSRISDSCVGDVGYKDVIFTYQGFINHE